MYRTPSRRVERYTYDAYGQPAVYNASWTAITEAASKDNALRFCGYVYDPGVGLYHVRHRTYTAPLGRWLQRDPAGYVDGMGLYEYCRGMVPTLMDPLGLEGLTWGTNGQWALPELSDVLSNVSYWKKKKYVEHFSKWLNAQWVEQNIPKEYDSLSQLGWLIEVSRYTVYQVQIGCKDRATRCAKLRYTMAFYAAAVKIGEAKSAMKDAGTVSDVVGTLVKTMNMAVHGSKVFKDSYDTAKDALADYERLQKLYGHRIEALEELNDRVAIGSDKIDEALGKVNKVISGIDKAYSIVGDIRKMRNGTFDGRFYSALDSQYLIFGGKLMQDASSLLPIDGVSDMVDFYGKAAQAIGGAIPNILQAGTSRMIHHLNNCDEQQTAPRSPIGHKWAREVLESSGTADVSPRMRDLLEAEKASCSPDCN